MFPSAVSAVEAAGFCQLGLGREAWPAGVALRVRMGLHTGEWRVRGGDQLDHAPINRCARVRAAAHGGQVLFSKATRDLVKGHLGGGFGLKELGEFRLRDLAVPELIYQLTHADLQLDFPPLRTVAERTGNLPLQVSSFVGRARELEQTTAAVEEARVVTLTGVGGVGKTRLALQAAGQVAARFRDGAWLCELAPVRDPAAVDDAVAAVFSVTAPAGQSAQDAVVEFLRSKQLLLVLDNCEHLLNGTAALAEVLQRSCERLVILATSREGLGIEGERLVPVPPLEIPSTDADLTAISQAEAVRLFADRAAAVKPEFTVTAENAASVGTTVRRLDGIALAIELAAARMAAMTPAELARRLERSFAVLAAGRRGTVPHHQTLRATIDWSFQLLAEPEQRLLCRLSVFAGGCTLEAAERVCSGEGIDPDTDFELLAMLLARSLVVAEAHGLETRYRLLETIRQYGEERLKGTGELQRWRARHADYYADLLPRVRDLAHHPRAEVFWGVQLSADQHNLLAAWSWAIDTDNVDTAFSILAGFAPSEVWTSYPLLLPGEAALALPGATRHPGYPLALAVSAVFASMRSDETGAEELCSRAAEANAGRDTPVWRVEETVCAAKSNIAVATGAFSDVARLSEQAPASHGPAATSSMPPSSSPSPQAVTSCLLTPRGRSLWRTKHSRWPAASAPRPSLRLAYSPSARPSPTQTPNRLVPACAKAAKLSTALGYQSALDHVWAAGIAFLVNDRAATLELGRRAIHALRWGGDRVRMGLILHLIAAALAATRPDAAAIIQGAADAYVVQAPLFALASSATITGAFGDARASELRARGADMDWDQALAYSLTQTTQALHELESQTQP